MMKSKLLTFTAIAALAANASPALAVDQAPAEPAGAPIAPKPSIEEELVYLRDIIALQTLRLDEAEQALARQTKMFESQQQKIAELERALGATRLALQQGAVFAAAGDGGAYIVKSGDTLGEIAAKYGTNVSALAAANGISRPENIRVGQRIVVPGVVAGPAVAAAETAPAAKVAKAPEAAPETKLASAEPPGPSPEARPDVTERVIQGEREKAPEGGLPQEVGVRPEHEDDRPEVAILPDVGGVLTPGGTFFIEPAFDYTVTSDNRFFFQGVEILDAILIGAIEATDSDRRARTESIGLRYGLTDRIEIDGRFSYVNRNDRVSGVAIDDGSTIFREINGSGIGDAELGVHYQLTNGRGFPYTVLNLRGKAPTGKGPFDVDRDARGIETELASGSGFWTIEPSVTFILPSDPAVVFANIGYQLNLETSPDEQIGTNTIIREFDPGDAIRASLGLGLALNDRMSINFAYDHTNLTRTEQVVENIGTGARTTVRQQPVTVGSFIVGGSYAVTDRVRLNLNTAFGATDEAPDMRVSLRAQVRLFD
jgi:murein DD-endopeptidase MepM/ murein hydrolase activator NlpD